MLFLDRFLLPYFMYYGRSKNQMLLWTFTCFFKNLICIINYTGRTRKNWLLFVQFFVKYTTTCFLFLSLLNTFLCLFLIFAGVLYEIEDYRKSSFLFSLFLLLKISILLLYVCVYKRSALDADKSERGYEGRTYNCNNLSRESPRIGKQFSYAQRRANGTIHT